MTKSETTPRVATRSTRPRILPGRTASAGLAALLLTSPACSASNLDVAACSSNEDCVDAFGPGYVCRSSGACVDESPEDTGDDESLSLIHI
ncbi:MAG: hypothetical protein KUG77_01520, partial [Nannocystaceae bacterium]|nr:hypothetical protein [Nannocystaceae bacterium]